MGFQDNVSVDVRGAAHIAPCTYKTVVLKQNITKENLNILTQAMLDEWGRNTKFVIKWDYILTNNITVPKHCLIEFDGGSVDGDGYTLTGDDTILIYNLDEDTVLKNVVFAGTFIRKTGGETDKKDNTDGMGKIILVNDKPFGEQLTQENTIYVIQYDFTLDEDITIPADCVLEFDGGSLSNGTIYGNGTSIKREVNKGIFTNIQIRGNWNQNKIYSDFFSDNITNNIVNLFALTSSDIYNEVFIDERIHLLSISSQHGGIIVKSNTHIHLSGTIQLEGTSFDSYRILNLVNIKNVVIDGGGTIIGDYGHGHSGSTGESGHGIHVGSCSNITIKDITIKDCWGDGIDTEADYDNVNNNIIIENCTIDNVRRNGITVVAHNMKISNCFIKNINGTSPKSGIDLEPTALWKNYNISIENVDFDNCYYGIYGISYKDDVSSLVYARNIYINNCTFNIIFRCICFIDMDSVDINNCYVNWEHYNDAGEEGNANYLFYFDGGNTNTGISPERLSISNIVFKNRNIEDISYAYYFRNTKTVFVNNCVINGLYSCIASSGCETVLFENNYISNCSHFLDGNSRSNFYIVDNNINVSDVSPFAAANTVDGILSLKSNIVTCKSFIINKRKAVIENNIFQHAGVSTILDSAFIFNLYNSSITDDDYLFKFKDNQIIINHIDQNINVGNIIQTFTPNVYILNNYIYINTSANWGIAPSTVAVNQIIDGNFFNGGTFIYGKIAVGNESESRRFKESTKSIYGGTSSRPTLTGENNAKGFYYFDKDLNKAIFWNGTAWVDATGATV